MKYKYLFALPFLVLTIAATAQTPEAQPPNTNPVVTTLSNPTPDHQPKQIAVSGAVMQGMLLKKVQPHYPQEAKNQRVQGTVVLAAEIDTTGHITDLKVLQGPDLLKQASLDAVKNWLYRPYLLNGEPVKVNTQINVVFSLGR